MDFVTCGDALWISCGTWLQMWSGSIGSFAGAMLAAAVALLVVLRSNRAQSKLSEKALSEQRREAALSREHVAASEVLGVLSEALVLSLAKPDGDAVAVGRLIAAIGRWQIASPDVALRNELSKWPPHFMLGLSLMRDPEIRALSSDEARDVAMYSWSVMSSVARDWMLADESMRAELLSRVKKNRDAFPISTRDELAETVSGP